MTSLFIVVLFVSLSILLINQASIRVWFISYVPFVLLMMKYGQLHPLMHALLIISFIPFIIGSITPLRRRFLSAHLFKHAKRVVPNMSVTEREALEAGSVGWEGELLSGSPDLSQLMGAEAKGLREDEQAFLDGPVNELCRMIDDWDITHHRTDMPAEMWQFIKKHRFFGMIIPKAYGGLGFSASAQMAVLVTLYGRSISVATSVAVPNSLGPAELLLKYGTEEQKKYYLPRLAQGIEIPCFALTGPNAGSDAASIPDKGEVCYQTINGKSCLGIRLNWDKRYITLSPVATLIGLAFRLYDPKKLLGSIVDIGISCALIPADTPGVVTGRRHFPLNTAFLNGPTQGKDVFIPIDYLIGGPKRAGQGWRMLMECLSAGRAISLPSSALGGVQAVALASGAYARVRKQFHQPISQFEGIEEALARIAGRTYMIDAALSMTTTAIDEGVKSSVAGAILKCHTTEWARQVIMDAMDIHGGKGICLGPTNYLGRHYQSAPIGITVEGANILTRSLIIFGQGAIRCHPYALKEIESIKNDDLAAFDQAIWRHAAFFLANCCQSLLFSWTDGYGMPIARHATKRYRQLIRRYSAHLAFVADFSMLVLGGELKRREKISARLGDVLSYLYVISAVVHRFYQEGEKEQDRPLVDWCCQQLFYDIQMALNGIITNFPKRWARWLLRFMVLPLGLQRQRPNDCLGKRLASLLTEPNESRSRLTRLVFKEPSSKCPLGQLESAFSLICKASTLEKKVALAVREKKIRALTFIEQIEEAKQQGILSLSEANRLWEAEKARQEVIAVDDFHPLDLAVYAPQSDENKVTSSSNPSEIEAC